MKIRIKSITLLLAVILTFSGLLSGSAPIRLSFTPPTEPSLQVPVSSSPATTQPSTVPTTAETTVPPTTEPTVPPTSEPTVPPTSEPTVPPTLEPTVPPTTVPTEPPTTAPTAPPATQPPATPLTAPRAFIYRDSDGSFPFLKGDMNERMYPASITKLFSAYVALQYLEPSAQITVGTAIYTVPHDSSLAHLSIGDVLTVEQLVYGMLLPSGGDAARVLAAEAGRVIAKKSDLSDKDAIQAFADEMNRRAAALSMTGSHFVNPDGFHDPNHYSTMADLLTLARLSLSTPLIRQAAATVEYPVTLAGRTVTWKNTNRLLHSNSQHPEFYRETAIGLKTGFTGAAGRCLLAAFVVNDELYYAGVFGCPDPNMTYITQFTNICYLYDTYIAP